jgi:hypothetical protein
MSKKKLTSRENFIKNATVEDIARLTWDASELAMKHDPDHHKWLMEISKVLNRDLPAIESRLDIIEQQLRRIGAPQYRRVRRGVLAEIVRGPKSAKNIKDYTL